MKTKIEKDIHSERINKKEFLSALFEYTTEAILVVDFYGEIIKSNLASERIFGYNLGELIGKKIDILVPNSNVDRIVDQVSNYLSNPHPRAMGTDLNLFGKRKDNFEFPVEMSFSTFPPAHGEYIIVFIIDITERKNAESIINIQQEELLKLSFELKLSNIDLEMKVTDRTKVLEEAIQELKKTKEELSESIEKEKELNEIKSRFITMASHEFRTPLTAVLSSLSLVSHYAESDQKEMQLKHINRIKSSVIHLTDILNDVLSLSKLEEGKFSILLEKFNLKEFVAEIVDEMKLQFKTNQLISYLHCGTEILVSDKKILKNILFNLISNAIKFSQESGIIEISTEISDSIFQLSVKDNGLGIPEDDKGHLFERFFRAKNATNIEGTGLGLSIVSKYIEMLGGKINYVSKLNEGTIFIIQLPIK